MPPARIPVDSSLFRMRRSASARLCSVMSSPPPGTPVPTPKQWPPSAHRPAAGLPPAASLRSTPWLRLCKDLLEESVENRAVRRGNKKPEAPVDQLGSCDPQQAGRRPGWPPGSAPRGRGSNSPPARNRRGRCIFPAAASISFRACWSSSFCISSSIWWTCSSWSSRCVSASVLGRR